MQCTSSKNQLTCSRVVHLNTNNQQNHVSGRKYKNVFSDFVCDSACQHLDKLEGLLIIKTGMQFDGKIVNLEIISNMHSGTFFVYKKVLHAPIR